MNVPKRVINNISLILYMAFKYKQKCGVCKTNYVTATRMQHFVVCDACQKKQFSGEITDPEMKQFFDIPAEFYSTNSFLRDIKVNYLKYGKLSERQIQAFKETVQRLKDKAEKSKTSV
jgi:hypothetical protein